MSYPEINALRLVAADDRMVEWIEKRAEQIRVEMWGALGLGTPGLTVGSIIHMTEHPRAEVMYIADSPVGIFASNARFKRIFLKATSGVATWGDFLATSDDFRSRAWTAIRTPREDTILFPLYASYAGADAENRVALARVYKAYLTKKGLRVRVNNRPQGTHITLDANSNLNDAIAFKRMFGTTHQITADLSSKDYTSKSVPIPVADGPMILDLFRAEIKAHPESRDTRSAPSWLRDLVEVVSDRLQSEAETARLGEWLMLRSKFYPENIGKDLKMVLGAIPKKHGARVVVENLIERSRG